MDIYDSSGSPVGYGYTDASGNYTAGGLTTGGYYAATAATGSGLNVIDEVYDNVPCVGSSYYGGCDVRQQHDHQRDPGRHEVGHRLRASPGWWLLGNTDECRN